MSSAPRPPATMCAAFRATVARMPDAVALRTVGDPTGITWAQYAARVREIAAGLAALGVRHGDTVALLLTNRPEFHLVDTAAQHLGAIPFSCYNSSSPQQIGHLLAASGARVAITERRLAAVLAGRPGDPLRHLVVIDGEPGSMTLGDVVAAGRPDFDLDAAARAVTPADLLTLVYTSGTTGAPKGVEITHAAMVAMAGASAAALGVRPGDKLISYLPSAHIADRWASLYLHTWAGTEITTLDDHRQILAALRDVRPTLFGGVPQVWQRIVGGIRTMLAAHPERARLEQAVDIGHRHLSARRSGAVPAELAAAHRAADEQALSAIRARLGLDRVRLALTSAAPTPPGVVEFVNAIGIPLTDAWGMSEVSGLATMNPPDDIRPGTVGRPIPGVEARLAPDGELLVRGPVVMRGYRGEPEETAAVLDADGWLHTGDIATIDADGYIGIVDRKKELLITSGGKNIAPAAVELAVRSNCPLVGQAVVVGDARPYLVALLVLDPEAVAAFAAAHGVEGEPATDPAVRAAVAAGVEAANATLSRAEQVRAFDIVTDQWQPGGDLLTATMKVRRRPVLAAYAERVERLYAASRRDEPARPVAG